MRIHRTPLQNYEWFQVLWEKCFQGPQPFEASKTMLEAEKVCVPLPSSLCSEKVSPAGLEILVIKKRKPFIKVMNKGIITTLLPYLHQ